MDDIKWGLAIARSLEEALTMYDAVPFTNDSAFEYSVPSYAIKASVLHTAMEQGIKCLIQISGAQPAKTHDLAKVYQQLNQSIQDRLNDAFKDAVSFYGYRKDRADLQFLTSLPGYLSSTATPDRFTDYRYWALEQNDTWTNANLAHLPLNRELVRFLADEIKAFGRYIGRPCTLSQTIEREIERRIAYHLNRTLPQDEDQSPREQLIHWLHSHNSLLLAMKEAYRQQFHVVNYITSEVLRSAYTDLPQDKANRVAHAIQHALFTFKAQTSDCPDVPTAKVELSHDRRTMHVFTPFGTPIGTAEEHLDGLWLVHSIHAYGRYALIAESKCDAIGLLIDESTQKVTVAKHEQSPKEHRVFFPANTMWPTLTPLDLATQDWVCEFWHPDHGLIEGDDITMFVTIPEHPWDWQANIHGTVTDTRRHSVTINGRCRLTSGT